MAGLLLATLFSGLLWTFFGPKYLFGFSVITIHIFLAVFLFTLIAWHAIVYRWIIGRPEVRDRRAFLHSSSLLAAGLVVWLTSVRAKRLLNLPGAGRRFTGSYEIGSFSPNFPSVSWINDRPKPVAIENWRLHVSGAIEKPLTLDYHQLSDLAQIQQTEVLDCTGGWYSQQSWIGVPLAAVLELASPTAAGRSITFQSITGYNRRFSMTMADSILLATHVAGETLSHGHGYPLRLVIPGERGLNWVKWLTHILINTTPHYLQSPLPTQ
jgi:DMSO/TMAO reductase YedYZ molybdopterin-dependent catalytic subunit